jgi:hypothetical protein
MTTWNGSNEQVTIKAHAHLQGPGCAADPPLVWLLCGGCSELPHDRRRQRRTPRKGAGKVVCCSFSKKVSSAGLITLGLLCIHEYGAGSDLRPPTRQAGVVRVEARRHLCHVITCRLGNITHLLVVA